MADDMTPGEASIARGGPQMNIHEARAEADQAGTVRGQAPMKTADREILESGPRSSVATSNLSPTDPATGDPAQSINERPPDDRPFTDSETALGGADAVQKTTWGVGHGTEPTGTEEYAPVGHDLKKGDTGPVVARVASGGGLSPVVLIVGVLAVLALLVYAFGIFGGRH